MKQKGRVQNGIKRLAVMALAGTLAFGTIGYSRFGMRTVEAAGEIVIDETTFPDEVFRKAISEIADTNKDGKLSSTERAAVTELILSKTVTGDIIGSAKGVERFPNLVKLNLDDQQIKTINLSKNTKLETLSLNGNQLTKLDLTLNENLWYLYCQENQLEELILGQKEYLNVLICGNNQLAELDLSGADRLMSLNCSKNILTKLNLENFKGLEEVNCEYNRLTELVVKGDTLLNYLKCGNNKLTSLDLTGIGGLWDLHCEHNQLSALDVSKMGSSLVEMECGYNRLTSLDVSANKYLFDLNCKNNKLKSLSLGSRIENLNCENNNLSSLDLSYSLNIVKLNCGNNNLTELNVSKCAKLYELICYGNALTTLDVETNKRLSRLDTDLVLVHPIVDRGNIWRVRVSLPAVYENWEYTYDISAFPYLWDNMIGEYARGYNEDGTEMKQVCVTGKNFTLSYPTANVVLNYTDSTGKKSSVGVYFTANLDAKLPTITKQPSNSVKTTGTASFSVQAEGDIVGYQWQELAPNSTKWSFCTNEGSTAATMKVGCAKELDGYKYRCAVINSKGMATYTKEVKYNYGTRAKIVTQPQDITAAHLDKVQFKVSAVGDGLTYQWYWRKDADSQWSETGFTGSTTDTMTLEVIPERNGYQYRCIVKDKFGYKATSDPAVLTVRTEAKIVEQPKSMTVKSGSKVQMKIYAVADGITYQWYWKANKEDTWTRCSGTGSKTDTFPIDVTSEMNGYQYCCVVYDTYGNRVKSSTAVLTVQTFAAITKQPVDAVQRTGIVTFDIKAIGDGLTYQWYWRKNSTSEWGTCGFEGNKTNALKVEVIPARNGYQYRCTVKDQYGHQVDSQYATLSYPNYAAITKQPDSISAVSGTAAKFSIGATGDGLTYQWYWRRDASSQWGVCGFTGSKTNTMTVDAITARNGFNYKCVVTDKYGTKAESKTAVLTVKTYANITAQPKSVLAKSGNVNFTVSAVGDGLTYQWYWRKNASSAWGVCGFEGCKTNNLTVEVISARNGYQYRCAVKDKYGHTVYSEPATLTYGSKVVITKQPVSIKAKAGTTAKFTVTVTGDGLTYQWYWRKNASSEWGVCGFTGSKTNAMSVEAIIARNGYQYKCVVKDKYGNTVNSSVATFTVE